MTRLGSVSSLALRSMISTSPQSAYVTMYIPRSISTFEVYTAVTSCTVPNRHQHPHPHVEVFGHFLATCSTNSKSSSRSSPSRMIILSISNHHFGMVLHTSVAEFGVPGNHPVKRPFVTNRDRLDVVHVFIINHGIAVYALPVCYFACHGVDKPPSSIDV